MDKWPNTGWQQGKVKKIMKVKNKSQLKEALLYEWDNTEPDVTKNFV